MIQSKAIAITFFIFLATGFEKSSPESVAHLLSNQAAYEDNFNHIHNLEVVNGATAVSFVQPENVQNIHLKITKFVLEQNNPCRFSMDWQLSNNLGFQTMTSVS